MSRTTDEMRHAEAVRDLEAGLGPFDDPGWREDLALLSSAVRFSAIALANDCETLVHLAARVPRSPGDERGGTPWTSFLREVAVVRKTSDRAASAEVALAHGLVQRHPRTLAELRAGRAPAYRARLLVEECAAHTDPVAAAADDALATRLAMLPPWRIRQEVARIALRLDAEAAARREAVATAARTARRSSLPDAQAEITLTGPAVVVQRWWDALTERAQGLKAAGDPRSLGALRFDLAMQTDPRGLTGRDDLTGALGLPGPLDSAQPGVGVGLGVVLRDDARCTRPVQASVTVPAATALGLSDEPGWLDGYGWISAPLSRRLLTVAELRKACVAPHSGQLLDLADRVARPRVSPTGLRDALREMVLDPHELRPVVTDEQPQHDPSASLVGFVRGRDRYCDGPSGTQVPAARTDRDHERPWPTGPTAAWNLRSRAARTHHLKHAGWVPARSAEGTTWTSPAGQVVHVPRFDHPPEPPPSTSALPAPGDLDRRDAALVQVSAWEDDVPTMTATATATATGADPGTSAVVGARLRHGWDDTPPF